MLVLPDGRLTWSVWSSSYSGSRLDDDSAIGCFLNELTATGVAGLELQRDDVVRELHAARDAGDVALTEELLEELAHIDFAYQETAAEPAGLTEEEEQALRELNGVNDGMDLRSIPIANVKDAFNRSGWLRPYAERRKLRPARRPPLVAVLHRRVRARLPRPRRATGSRTSGKDPPPSDPELDCANELSGHRPQPCPWRGRFSAGTDL